MKHGAYYTLTFPAESEVIAYPTKAMAERANRAFFTARRRQVVRLASARELEAQQADGWTITFVEA